MKNFKLLIPVFILVLTSILSVKYVFGNLFSTPGDITLCVDDIGLVSRDDNSQRQRYSTCIREEAKIFFDRDYAESKDMAKTFLTLISVILVASITFSEKIVDVNNADLASIIFMVFCWFLLLIAVIACGTGLVYMVVAAGMATYAPDVDYREIGGKGLTLLLASGVSFVCALVSLITAGVTSLASKRFASKSARMIPGSDRDDWR